MQAFTHRDKTHEQLVNLLYIEKARRVADIGFCHPIVPEDFLARYCACWYVMFSGSHVGLPEVLQGAHMLLGV